MRDMFIYLGVLDRHATGNNRAPCPREASQTAKAVSQALEFLRSRSFHSSCYTSFPTHPLEAAVFSACLLIVA